MNVFMSQEVVFKSELPNELLNELRFNYQVDDEVVGFDGWFDLSYGLNRTPILFSVYLRKDGNVVFSGSHELVQAFFNANLKELAEGKYKYIFESADEIESFSRFCELVVSLCRQKALELWSLKEDGKIDYYGQPKR